MKNLFDSLRALQVAKSDVEDFYKALSERLDGVPGAEKILKAVNNVMNEVQILEIATDDAIIERM
jgi:hypothetical protein